MSSNVAVSRISLFTFIRYEWAPLSDVGQISATALHLWQNFITTVIKKKLWQEGPIAGGQL